MTKCEILPDREVFSYVHVLGNSPENIPHRLSAGKDRTVGDGVNTSMQVSSEDLLNTPGLSSEVKTPYIGFGMPGSPCLIKPILCISNLQIVAAPPKGHLLKGRAAPPLSSGE